MRLLRLELKNFRRIAEATIHFALSTFIIGPNNTGKSSIISAIEALLSLEKEKLSQHDILEQPDGRRSDETSITAYFGEIPPDVAAFVVWVVRGCACIHWAVVIAGYVFLWSLDQELDS